MSDMIALLNDLSYIPSNNEQNEPTQEDIGETSNEPTQAKRNEFEELYVSANEELYLGCDYVTRLDFMAKFTYFKVKGKLTDSIFSEMLEFFQHVFPTTKGYKLPPLYYSIKKTFKTIELGYESIHACVNDCFLFRGDNNKDVHFCPVCKTSRWKDSNTPGKKVPKKCTEPGKMQHPVDGKAWKNFDTKYPNFAKVPRNVRLGLAVDGFNPFGNLSQAYNMWPVILTTHNLPPWLCMKESSFMLTLLIPGPKSPGKDIDVYLRPLIDDLKVLWALKCVETIDVAIGQKFNMRAMTLHLCVCVCVLDKTAYVGHRRFLKKPHEWRRSLEFNGEIEDGDPPRKFNRDQIQAQLARLPMRVKGKHPSYGGVKIKRNVLVDLNWTKRSIFYELEYWSFLTLKHNLDIMHIEKNVLEAILNTLLMNEKSKDTAKARQDLKRLGIRSGLWLGQTKNEKCSKSQQYLPDEVAKPIIELCSFFKQICYVTLMEDDILKAQSKVVDILCNLELIYPPAFFDIMIHLVIHLPLEALEGGPIRPRRNERRTTQNSGICSPGGKDGEMYYGQLQEILEFLYLSFKVVLSACQRMWHGATAMTVAVMIGPLHTIYPPIVRVASITEGGRKAGRLHTRQETRNLGLKKITDDKGLVPIRFEWDDKKTMMPLGDHASHWSNYLGELIREMPLYYPSWQKVPAERKAVILTKIGTQFELKPHMQSQRWTDINAGIQQHLQKLASGNDVPRTLPQHIGMPNLPFGMIPEIKPEPLKIAKTGQRARSYAGRDPGHLLAFEIRCSSTQEYPSLIDTFFLTHTVGAVFVRDEDRALYDEMLRLQRLGSNTETGVPYTEEDIMAIVKMMMRLFRSDNKFSQMLDQFESSPEFGGPSGGGGCGDHDLPETMRAPPSRSGKSPGKVSLASFPLQLIPGDMSPGIGIPSDKSPGKAWNCRWG
ncbi:hypothetical protein Tco_1466111 [Tanacetum coccineum]